MVKHDDVPEQEHIPQQGEQKPGLLPNGNTAAEVGVPNHFGLYGDNTLAMDVLKAATIERCAQVALEWLRENGYEPKDLELVSAIRALKDKP